MMRWSLARRNSRTIAVSHLKSLALAKTSVISVLASARSTAETGSEHNSDSPTVASSIL